MFTGIPKTGCTNWKILLLELEGALDSGWRKRLEKNPPLVHTGISHPYRLPQYWKWEGRYDERIKRATSLVVLRNPWVRAVSAFLQKLSGEKDQRGLEHKTDLPGLQKNIVNSLRGGWKEGDHPTFEEFIRYSIQENGISNIHFKPQIQYLDINTVRYNLVIPLEHIDKIAPQIFQSLSLEGSLMPSYDSRSDARNQSSATETRELFSSLDDDLVEKFYEIYKYDFQLLNYSNFTDPDFPFPKL